MTEQEKMEKVYDRAAKLVNVGRRWYSILEIPPAEIEAQMRKAYLDLVDAVLEPLSVTVLNG